MSVTQFSILRRIARQEPLPLMQLADLLVMDRTTLYRALRPICRRGWVAIVDGQGRSKAAKLTTRGRRAVTSATSAWEAVQAKLLGKVGAGEWKSIEASLARLIEVTRELAT